MLEVGALPRIIYLHQALTALASTISPAAWAIDWAGHLARVTDLLHARTTEAARPALLAELTAHEKDLIGRMLERRLDA
ncbi:hypothetical protein ACFV0O_11810 [Kitasatospora sp. NPDC059577]|uniref:hypothetical protein n=1 Tax=Kitasatospora sp. NPDC059577 TaxID=3346873 RepID=UPI00368B84AC